MTEMTEPTAPPMPERVEIHPAADLFPMMRAEELQQLADDIKANGLRDPIVLLDGQILDGRNRLEACRMAGVEPRYEEINLHDFSPTLYVISKNLHRRHLTASQRAAIGAKMMPRLREEAAERLALGQKHGGETGGNGRSKVALTPVGVRATRTEMQASALAARAVGVGRTTVERAARVQKDNPELFAKIERGEVNCWKAEHILTGQVRPSRAKSEDDPPDKPRKANPCLQSDFHVRRRQIAAKRRMVEVLSHVRGLCRGVAEIDMTLASALLDDDEKKTWIAIAKESFEALRAFARKMEATR
jgi:hypothetical protein